MSAGDVSVGTTVTWKHDISRFMAQSSKLSWSHHPQCKVLILAQLDQASFMKELHG